MSVYALGLKDDKYYVGYSKYPNKRIKQHFDGNGSMWTKKHKPVSVIYCVPGTLQDELTNTKIMMEKFGIKNVRGACYTAMELKSYVVAIIQKEFNHLNDKCFKCGGDHYVNFCEEYHKLAPKICDRCGRSSHSIDNCYANTHINGKLLGKKSQKGQIMMFNKRTVEVSDVFLWVYGAWSVISSKWWLAWGILRRCFYLG